VKPLILLDLDRTIFDTAQYVAEMPSLLMGYTQKTASEISEYIPSMLSGERDKLHRADYDDFVHFLGMNFDEFSDAITGEAVMNHYLYDDAKYLVSWLKHNNLDFEILTFGDPKVQQIKLSITPFLTGINASVIDTLKNAYIKNTLGNAISGVLIDDKPDQQLPQGWTEIHIDRKAEQPFTPRQLSDGVWRISSLEDAPQIIEHI
jgi:hypothetical protein